MSNIAGEEVIRICVYAHMRNTLTFAIGTVVPSVTNHFFRSVGTSGPPGNRDRGRIKLSSSQLSMPNDKNFESAILSYTILWVLCIEVGVF